RSIPPGIEWALQVDGHTDVRPIASAAFPSNWELSSARATTVVKYLISRGVSPRRLVAAGYGEFQPLEDGVSEDVLRRNRRIELKLTNREPAVWPCPAPAPNNPGKSRWRGRKRCQNNHEQGLPRAAGGGGARLRGGKAPDSAALPGWAAAEEAGRTPQQPREGHIKTAQMRASITTATLRTGRSSHGKEIRKV